MEYLQTQCNRILNKCGFCKKEQYMRIIEEQRLVIQQQQYIIQQYKQQLIQEIEQRRLIKENQLMKKREQQLISHKQLRSGCRYWFTEHVPHSKLRVIFRATVVNIFKTMITVNCHEKYNDNKKLTVTIPLDWIHVDTLDSITRKSMRLPPEILEIIESYL